MTVEEPEIVDNLPADPDYVPDELIRNDEGEVVKIPANNKCRGVRSTADTYCGNPAGKKTIHLGEGRCHLHGGVVEGDGRIKRAGGVFSGYEQVRSKALGPMLDKAQKMDPTDLSNEVNQMRAIVLKMKQAENISENNLMKFLDMTGRMVDRLHQHKSENAISIEEFSRIQYEMGKRAVQVAERHLDEDELDEFYEELQEKWNQIRLTDSG